MIIDIQKAKAVIAEKNAPRQLPPDMKAILMKGVFMPKPESCLFAKSPEEILSDYLTHG